MRAVKNNRALRAQKTVDLLRIQIDALEGFIEKRRAETIAAINLNDWAVAAERCNAAAEHQSEAHKRWEAINNLRVTIDEGTTHIEEEGDYA